MHPGAIYHVMRVGERWKSTDADECDGFLFIYHFATDRRILQCLVSGERVLSAVRLSPEEWSTGEPVSDALRERALEDRHNLLEVIKMLRKRSQN